MLAEKEQRLRGDPFYRTDLSVSLEKLGDVASTGGDLSAAGRPPQMDIRRGWPAFGGHEAKSPEILKAFPPVRAKSPEILKALLPVRAKCRSFSAYLSRKPGISAPFRGKGPGFRHLPSGYRYYAVFLPLEYQEKCRIGSRENRLRALRGGCR
ncbi:MAG: hypothetical protein GY856_18340 [bacterium]|nr:hypothetical protein [bacterium]